MLPANPVAMTFHFVSFDQIHFSAKQNGKFVSHVVAEPWTVRSIFAKAGSGGVEKINIAVGSEVITKCRAKQFESDNAPTPAKIGYFFWG